MAKIGPKEQQRRALRERQKQPVQRAKLVSGAKPRPTEPDATPDEILRLLKQRDKRRAKARVYQRSYYKTHRDQMRSAIARAWNCSNVESDRKRAMFESNPEDFWKEYAVYVGVMLFLFVLVLLFLH